MHRLYGMSLRSIQRASLRDSSRLEPVYDVPAIPGTRMIALRLATLSRRILV